MLVQKHERSETYWFVHNGEEVGYFQLSPSGGVSCVNIIDPAMRNKGLGTQMMKECVERARELGIKRLCLGAANTRAKKVYLKVGFRFIPGSYRGHPDMIRACHYWIKQDPTEQGYRMTKYDTGRTSLMEMIL